MKISSGPNLQWYLAIVLFIFWSFVSESFLPIIIWLGIGIVLIPVSFLAYKFLPKHTLESTAKELSEGLKDGSIVLDKDKE